MLPFTHAQFLAVFAAYNTAVWPAQPVAYALGVVLLGLLVARHMRHPGRWVALGLSVLWLWTGVGYHWLQFAAINRAAWGFGTLFVAEGVLLAVAALRDRLSFTPADGTTAALGWVLVAYAMVAYPLLGLVASMRYPTMPMFGITPCPLTIFTLGLFLLARPAPPKRLVVVPLLWGLVGGSAALLLGVPQDWPLLASGLIVGPLLLRQRHANKTAST